MGEGLEPPPSSAGGQVARPRVLQLSKKIIKQVHNLHGKGWTTVPIAKELGISKYLVTRTLRDVGVSAMPIGRPRVFTFDERFFDKIDSQASAYLLGLIAADGSVYDNRLCITLAEKDREHLELVKECMGSSPEHKLYFQPPHRPGQSNHYRLQYYSKHMFSALARYGIVPNKTATFIPPKLHQSLRSHFWRGYFDGDGSIFRVVRANGTVRWIVNLVGTKATMLAFHKWATKFVPQLTAPFKKWDKSAHLQLWEVRCTGVAKPKFLVEALYRDSAINLKRKRLLARQLMDEPVKRSDSRWGRGVTSS